MPSTPLPAAATGLPEHPSVAALIGDHEDDVRAVPELLTAAMQLAELDDTHEGRALLRVIAVALTKAEAVLAMWEGAFAASRCLQ